MIARGCAGAGISKDSRENRDAQSSRRHRLLAACKREVSKPPSHRDVPGAKRLTISFECDCFQRDLASIVNLLDPGAGTRMRFAASVPASGSSDQKFSRNGEAFSVGNRAPCVFSSGQIDRSQSGAAPSRRSAPERSRTKMAKPRASRTAPQRNHALA